MRDESQTPSPDEPASAGTSDYPNPGSWITATFSALTVRNYRLFYIGHGISLTGTWVRRTALGWLVYEITRSKTKLGLVMGLAMFPLFILSPSAGALSDRVDKRRLIALTQVIAFLVSATIALLVWIDSVAVWQLEVLAVLGGITFAFEVPARQAFVGELVGRGHLANAVALNSALVNLTRVIGPAIAGYLMGTIGMEWCFTLDALSYLFVIVTLVLLKLPVFKKPPYTASHLAHLVEGGREVLRNRPVLVVLIFLMLTGVFGWSFQTILPAIVQDNLHWDEKRYGMLVGMFGIGALAGALTVAGRRPPVNNLFRHLLGGIWIMGLGLAVVPLATAYPMLCVAMVISGFGAIYFLSLGNSTIQLNVADNMRGRVMGLWALGFGGSLPLGSFLVGFVAERIAPMITVTIFATIMIGTSLLAYWFLGAGRLGRELQGPPSPAQT